MCGNLCYFELGAGPRYSADAVLLPDLQITLPTDPQIIRTDLQITIPTDL